MQKFDGTDYAVVGAASLFLLLGVVLLTFGVRNLWRGHASEGWPTTPAIVSNAETSANTVKTTTYSAKITFRYQVGGREYTTAVRQFGQLEGDGDSSEAVIVRFRYPLHAAVAVSYNPADPSIAAAEPGFTSDALWLPGGGLAFAVPAVMFMVLWFGMSRGNVNAFAIAITIFSGIFATFGTLLLASGLTHLYDAWQSPHWPQTKGVIVYGRVDQTLNHAALIDGTGQFVEASGDRVVYRYQVAGRTYFSNVRRFGQLPESNGLDRDVPELYPLGREMPVVYSPSNPRVCALEAGPAKGSSWIPCAGGACLLFGLAVYFATQNIWPRMNANERE